MGDRGASHRAPSSLSAAWRARVRAAPDAPAIRHFDTVLSAEEVERRTAALAAALAAEGIGHGDRVGLHLQNVPDHVVGLLALWRLGAIAALMNPMYAGDELRHLVTDSGAVGMIVDPELVDQAREAADGTDVQWIWPGGDDLARRVEDTGAVGDEAQDVEVGPDDVAMLTYTSGTTGPPKGAMNTHGNVLAVVETCGDWMELTPDDVVLCVAPMFHITGAVITMATPLLRGCTVDLIGRTRPEAVLEAIATHGVTTTTGSITVYNGLTRLPDIGRESFASVRHLYSGGAPVPPATVARFRDDYGCYIHNIYGMTETTSAVIGVPPGQEAPVDPDTGSLSIGRAFPGLEVRIVDADGRELEPGEHGELELTGPSVVPGYWQQPEATAETFPGGRLRTGDGAMVDEDGWVYIVDRLKDQINVSGYKVWPREVEDALHLHPTVHEAAVVGEPDDYQGERVAAYVTCRSGSEVSEEELIAFVKEHLAAYKVPRRVEVIDELPKTSTGKIRRRALREDTDRA